MITTSTKIFLLAVVSILNLPGSIYSRQTNSAPQLSGELKKWHKVTVTFDGPLSSETGSTNPFLDFRLDVTFTHSSGKSYKVPGYFAADGNASETGATSGSKWRVHFAPDLTGTWSYQVSMRQGTAIAVSDVASAGTAVSGLDGISGTFSIAASDKTGVDLRAKGRLIYTGDPYLQFAETGEYFRKTGADAPENFLAYNDFDNTSNYNNYRKSWSPHVIDWQTGDPVWKSTLGKGIIGALNYLSSVGMNTFSFLTMNIKGDDRNVWPYIDTAKRTRMDVSKLDQWEIVFDHAQKKGLHLHFKTQEVENCTLLDGGAVGTERRLYYRELIARFGHHLALSWNLGEENVQTTQQQKDMAQYFWDHDPYRHNIDLHTFLGQQETNYRPLLGTASALTGVSIQADTADVYPESRKWVEASAAAGKKWIVANDEQGSADVGVAADANYTGNRGTIPDNSDQIRRSVLWGNLMAGGAGVEYYFGGSTGETDLTCQDFRSRAKSWGYAKIAQDFFHNYFPFTVLKPLSNTASGWSLGNDSTIYVVYLKTGGTASITLPTGTYSVQWYNPRTGGALQNGTVSSISSGTVSIGYPPSETTSDWTAFIQRTSKPAPAVANYRINAGGPQVTNSIGTFTADAYYSPSPGNTYSTTSAIAGTTNGAMYQTERYGTNGTFSYAFPVSNGSYKVTLHFVELYWTAVGKRVFDVNIEGNKVLDNYDIFQNVGAFTATSKTFAVNVTDGVLNIYFSSLPVDGGADQPEVSAIEILPNTAASVIPVANAGLDQSITLPTNSVMLDGSASSDPNGVIASYSWTQVSGPNTASFSPNAAAQKPTVSGLVAGRYIFSLVVTNTGKAVSKPDSIVVTVNGTSGNSGVISFTLVNASTNQDIQTINNGATLNLATLPSRSLNIRANTSPAAVGSVVLILSGGQSRTQTESGAPYALFGDNSGVYNAWTPFVGSYTLKATPYAGSGGGGTAGASLSITFNVIDQAATITASKAISTEEPVLAQPSDNTFKAYPNPSINGHYTVLLPQKFEGELSYSLINSSGAWLTGGKLSLIKPLSILQLDFSHQTGLGGVYYLQLEGAKLKASFKLIRLNK